MKASWFSIIFNLDTNGSKLLRFSLIATKISSSERIPSKKDLVVGTSLNSGNNSLKHPNDGFGSPSWCDRG